MNENAAGAAPAETDPTATPVAPAPSATVAGDMLRQAREAAGLHIATLAVSLKVPIKKLEALEAGRIDQLPDAVFVRALAASVCRSLKMDPAPVLAQLPQTNVPKLTPDEDGINAPFRSPDERSGSSWLEQVSRPALFGGLLLVMGALVLIFLPRAFTTAPGTTNEAEKPQEVFPLNAGPAGTEARADAGSTANASPASSETASPPNSAGTQMAAAPAVPEAAAPSKTVAHVVTASAKPAASAAGAKPAASMPLAAAKPAASAPLAAAKPAASAPLAAAKPAASAPLAATKSAASAPLAAAKPTASAPLAAAKPAASASMPATRSSTVATLAPGSGLLSFRASGQSWVEVTDAKGTPVLRRTLEAGEVVDVAGVPPLAVVIGRADVTRLQVRGKPFELQGLAKDNVARFEIK